MITVFCFSAFFLYSFLVGYLFYGIQKSQKSSGISGETKHTFVSIILAVCNEEKNIGACLDCLLLQDYPGELFEIIIANDSSTDGTKDILKQYASRSDLIKLVQGEKNGWKSRKKNALVKCIQMASGSIFLFTDADCRPPAAWIRTMISFYHYNTGLVAGFSPQQCAGSRVWNGFLYTDSLAAAYVAAGSIGLGRGITCTGRNLSYSREAYLKINGFNQLPDSLSGDDDFVLQTISEQDELDVKYAFPKNSHVAAIGPYNFSEFLRQKQRHISAGKYFTRSQQLGYAIYHTLNYALWIFGIGGLLNPVFFVPLAGKLVIDALALGGFSRSLESRLTLAQLGLWEILFPVYNILAAPIAFLGSMRWKHHARSRA